jgi:sec-independent protein translocase protein TatB
MFGIDASELLVVAVVALLFIGPKELPRVMMQIGRWVGKVRGYARHFTSGIENVIREAELEEMEKTWREQNEQIMKQFPPDATYAEPAPVMTSLPPTEAQGEGLPQEAFSPAEPTLPLEAPAAPDEDPTPPEERPLP